MKPPVHPLAELVRELDRAGVHLWLEGARVAFAGPLPASLRVKASEQRRDLVELLEIHGEALLPLFRERDQPNARGEASARVTNPRNRVNPRANSHLASASEFVSESLGGRDA